MKRAGVAAGVTVAAVAAFWLSFNTFARIVTAGYQRFEEWRTWQAASPGQRWRWMRVRPLEHLDGDRFDLWDNDLRSE